jgi:hypothetical protein
MRRRVMFGMLLSLGRGLLAPLVALGLNLANAR